RTRGGRRRDGAGHDAGGVQPDVESRRRPLPLGQRGPPARQRVRAGHDGAPGGLELGPVAQVPLSSVSGGRAGAWLAAVTLTLLAGASLLRPGPLPRLGPLLDPVRGIWSVAREAELPARAIGAIPGLTAPVTVRYDDRAVPHIFAANELDATRALGYVVA